MEDFEYQAGDVTPHAYRIILIQHNDDTPLVKVFAAWNGAYVYGESWKLNSGTTRIEDVGKYYAFHGYSGSRYLLDKKNCGNLSSFCYGIYEKIVNQKQDGYLIKEISVEQAIEIVNGEGYERA